MVATHDDGPARPGSGDATTGLVDFPGTAAVLAAHALALPQPDQLDGPFSAYVALHALRDDPPSVVALAVAAGATVWPHETARPEGAASDRTGWERLGTATGPGTCGTQASGLAIGLGAVAGVAVVPVPGGDPHGTGELLAALTRVPHPVGVVAHLGAGTAAASGVGWTAGPAAPGRFVVLHGLDPARRRVGVADTYPELGAPDEPPGCRTVGLDDLVGATAAEPGRGLLLVVRAEDEAATRDLVAATGLPVGLWSA